MDIDRKLYWLAKKWDIIVLSCGGGSPFWTCADHTDEGIGGTLTFSGASPIDAVTKAYEYVFNGRGEPDN